MLDWVELLAIILLNGLVDVLLVAWVAGRRSKEALQKWLESKESQEALHNLLSQAWIWFLEPSIKTGKTIKVGEGEEEKAIPEVLSPFQNLAQETGRYMILKLRSSIGGKKSQMGDALAADLADPNSPLASSLGGIFPRVVGMGRKGGGGGLDAVIEIINQFGLGPTVQNYIKKKLESSIGGGGQGSW